MSYRLIAIEIALNEVGIYTYNQYHILIGQSFSIISHCHLMLRNYTSMLQQ